MTFPVIGILIWRSYQQNKVFTGRELLFRYAVYTLAINLITSLAMVIMCDEGTSFWTKMDESVIFTLKFAALELMAMLFVVGVEWMYVTRRLTVKVNWQEYREMGLGKFVEKTLFPCGIYLMAAVTVLLNVSLMFDNVLWGDECFSASTAQSTVDGVLQRLYYWDNHPPLHYYWLKMFGELFGHSGPVYHLASLVPFFIGILLALIFLRRHFGNIPTAFFVIITGLAYPCIQYNLEIRMYSLAFLSVACCYYCAYRVLSGGRFAWFGMVFWALFGAYAHYYALMTAGILIFITGVAAAVRYRGKTWIKGLLALLAYVAGYVPWFGYLFRGISGVHNNWWVTEIMSLQESLQMVLCGVTFQKIVLCLSLVFLAALLLTESSFFTICRYENSSEISVHRPRLKNWSNETYGVTVGALTIIGTLTAAYILCLVMDPVLVDRYLYPLSAITVMLLVMGAKGSLGLVKKLGEKTQKTWLEPSAKSVLILVLAALFFIGLGNYNNYRTQVKSEQAATEQVIALIGEVPEDTVLVSNNVKHLSWTVLGYYYPDRDIIAGGCTDEGLEYNKFWYFTTSQIDKAEADKLSGLGYTTWYYGHQQIAVYPFELYYFEREEKTQK